MQQVVTATIQQSSAKPYGVLLLPEQTTPPYGAATSTLWPPLSSLDTGLPVPYVTLSSWGRLAAAWLVFVCVRYLSINYIYPATNGHGMFARIPRKASQCPVVSTTHPAFVSLKKF